MNNYYAGNVIRVSASFVDTDGSAIDPTAVMLSYRLDVGSVTTLTYGTDAALVKDSTGHYHVDLDASTKGTYYYRWSSTRTGQAAAENAFAVVGEIGG